MPNPERLEAVDALRGFALFGVVISNAAVFTAARSSGGFDQQVEAAFYFLVTGKFLGLFALLFGASFALFMGTSSGRPERSAADYLRRLIALFVIGVLHRVLFGVDVLMPYAVVGLILLALRKAPDRWLLVAAVLGLILTDVWQLFAASIHYVPPPPLLSRADRMRLATEGPYLELVWMRLQLLPRWWNTFISQDTIFITPMALGCWVARRQALQSLTGRSRQLRTWCLAGVGLTLIGYLGQTALRPSLANGGPLAIAFGPVWQATTYSQAVAYGAGFLWLWTGSETARRGLSLLIPAGRMALTHYLSVSIVFTAAMAATRMYGRVGFLAALTMGALLYLIQLAWSSVWLRSHRSGPAEWAWRRMARLFS